LLPKILRELLHRLATCGGQRFDVVRLGDSDGTVSQNRLTGPVLNSKPVQICCKSCMKSVPTVPRRWRDGLRIRFVRASPHVDLVDGET